MPVAMRKQRILLSYPPSSPCIELIDWTRDYLERQGFEAVLPTLRVRSFGEFRSFVQSVDGIVALLIPFDIDESHHTSAWVHNSLGAIAAQEDPPIPTLAIFAQGIDVGGLSRLDECRCPVKYPWRAEVELRQRALERIEDYLAEFRDSVRKEAEPKLLQVTVLLVDIVAFTLNEFRADQLLIADRAKQLLREVAAEFQDAMIYKSEGGDGGYFVFGMDFAAINVLRFAQEILQAFRDHPSGKVDPGEEESAIDAIRVRIAIDCGAVGRGTSVVNWRRSTLIGPPMNVCQRIIGHAPENSIVTSEKFYQLLRGEKYAGLFSINETIYGKHGEDFVIRQYDYRAQDLASTALEPPPPITVVPEPSS